MTKDEWWSSLDDWQRKEIKKDPETYRDIYNAFGPFQLEIDLYEGVEPFPESPKQTPCWWKATKLEW